MLGEWTRQQFNESLAKKKTVPLYFLYGDESYLVDEAMHSLVNMALGESLRDFNLDTYFGDEASGEQIRDAIETLPSMALQRVVVVRAANHLKEKDWESLLSILQKPVPSTVFICVANKFDKRKKASKVWLENGAVIEFKRPFENEIPHWIVAIAKKHGLELDGESKQVFQQLVGNNLTDIAIELSKLADFVSPRKAVVVDDVLDGVSRVRLNSIFELTEAIGRNDRVQALYCLANLLDQGEEEVRILSMITRHFRILKLVADGAREGLSGLKLAARAGVSNYFLKQYLEQSRKWNDTKLEQAFMALLQTDRALKTSPVASHIWLENFIVQSCCP